MFDTSTVDNYLPQLTAAVTIAVILIGFVLTITVLRIVLRYIKTVNQPMVSLQLIPPSKLFLPSSANTELFQAVHELLKPTSLYDRLIGYCARASFEIISDRRNGIRYVVTVPENLVSAIEQQVAGYLPETKIVMHDNALPINLPSATFRQFRQKLHFAYPLQVSENLHEHDPISYLTNAMTKLNDKELIAIQLTVRPVHRADVNKLSNQIRSNEDVLTKLDGQLNFGIRISSLLSGFTSAILDSVSGIFRTSMDQSHMERNSVTARKAIDQKAKPVRYLSSFEYDLVSTIDSKLSQALFEAELRTVVCRNDKQSAQVQTKSILAAISLTSVSKYQALISKRPISSLSKYLFNRRLERRLFKPKPSLILSTSELAALYHFPTSTNTRTDNLVTSLSKTLPAPLSLKNGSKLDVILGENQHHGLITPIGLTSAERERHLYIVGGTGNGKTTMLLYAIVQDIKSGKGLAVIDPHGDLAETILDYIPKERITDIIYLNPDDLERPIGINLLELTPGLSGNELLREKDLITESVISVLRKIFSEDDTGGHRIEYVLRNTIQTALTIEGANLFTIFRLLNNTKYRRGIVRNLEDEDLKNFWNNELGKAGEFQKVKMAAGITAKIGRFLFSATARKMLEQEKSSINFEDILSTKKILICNFSKGVLGEDTSTLFGTTVLAKLQVAALRRAKLAQVDRTPYHLYVDEFQNFATMSFVQMLSEARKYKLYLTMAEQSTAQQEQQRMVDIILANVGTVICFRTGSPADEKRLLPLFIPFINEGEISNLSPFNFYARLSALHSQEPLSGNTLTLASVNKLSESNTVKAFSRDRYGVASLSQVDEIETKDIHVVKKHSRKPKNYQKLTEPI